MAFKNVSPFRMFVHNLWIDNCTEYEAFGGSDGCIDLREYFNKFKWWLKREYKYQQSKGLH